MTLDLELGDDVFDIKAVNDSGYDKTADSRQRPETRITSVTARCGSVVIIGEEDGQPTEKQITIDEAVNRCRALIAMAKAPHKYPSDQREVRKLVSSFASAVELARSQLSAALS